MRIPCLVVVVLGLLCGCEPAPTTSSATPVNLAPAPPAPPPPPGTAADPVNPAAPSSPPTQAETAAQIDPGVAGDVAMAAVPLSAKALLNASADMYKTLSAITDGPSANAAAPTIKSQALQIKAHLPAFKLFMATAPKEQVLLVLQKQAADQMATAPANRVDLIELARQPGNEAFREAYIFFLHVQRDDGTSGTRRSAERELAKIEQP